MHTVDDRYIRACPITPTIIAVSIMRIFVKKLVKISGLLIFFKLTTHHLSATMKVNKICRLQIRRNECIWVKVSGNGCIYGYKCMHHIRWIVGLRRIVMRNKWSCFSIECVSNKAYMQTKRHAKKKRHDYALYRISAYNQWAKKWIRQLQGST